MPYGPLAPGLAPGGILALDLSGIVGFAYGLPTERHPTFGSWALARGERVAARYVAFENVLANTIEMLQPEHVCVEAPLHLPAMNNVEAAQQAYVMDGIVRMEAFKGSVSFHAVDTITVRMEMIGKAHWQPRPGQTKTAATKQAILAHCRSWGWDCIDDHHAADAVLVWAHYATAFGGISRARAPKLRFLA